MAPRGVAAAGTARSLVVVLVAVAGHLAAQTSMLVTRPDFSLWSFRGYYPYDQLSYLAIVVNGSQGRSDFVEPFTSTGLNYYPHAYYLLLGLVSRVTGASPLLAWSVCGLLLQAALVAAVAATTVRLTGRAWPGLLAPLPFLVGTLSTLRDGDWLTRLDSHAVLWGPFGVLFTLNGEAASLCVGGLALLALLLVAEDRVGARARLPVAVAACLAIGALGNVQTYSFLAAVYLASSVAAVLALLRALGSRTRGRWVALALTVAAVPLLVLLGPAVADRAGPLAVLALGLVPAAPGLLLLVVQTRGRALWCAAAAAVGAAPQLLWTVRGVAVGEPFLLYRQSSSTDLGMGLVQGVSAAAVPALVLLAVAVAGAVRRRPLWVATALGGGLSWLLVASNDRWGADQEPYRFWLDTYVLLAVVLVPVASAVALSFLGRRGEAAATPAGGRWAAAAAVLAVAVVAAVSAADFVGFWRYGRTIPLLDYSAGRADAVARAVAPTAGEAGLRLGDPCVDPFTVKIVSGVPTAFYNYGMAWPEAEPPLFTTLAAREQQQLDVAAAQEAGVAWVLTDSSCASAWPERFADRLEAVDEAPYAQPDGSGTVTLWRLLPAPA